MKPYYILSLDGGGIRGLITITFLEKLEEYLQTIDPEFKIYSHFDMFAGTSIGALIILLITLKKKSMKEIKDIFTIETCKKIMPKSLLDEMVGLVQPNPKYDGKGKTQIIEEYLGDSKYCDTDKTILIPAYDIENRVGKIFNSNNCHPDLLAKEVADGTSASPAYFPCKKIRNCGTETENYDSWFIDGGVIANNPTMCAISEVYNKMDKNREIIVLNIGTGYRNRKIDGKKAKSFGGPEWICNDIIGISMDESLIVQQAKKILNHNYICINNPLLEANDELDYCTKKNLQDLIKTGENWWNENKKIFKNFLNV